MHELAVHGAPSVVPLARSQLRACRLGWGVSSSDLRARARPGANAAEPA